jgi:hypothetical protein
MPGGDDQLSGPIKALGGLGNRTYSWAISQAGPGLSPTHIRCVVAKAARVLRAVRLRQGLFGG